MELFDFKGCGGLTTPLYRTSPALGIYIHSPYYLCQLDVPRSCERSSNARRWSIISPLCFRLFSDGVRNCEVMPKQSSIFYPSSRYPGGIENVFNHTLCSIPSHSHGLESKPMAMAVLRPLPVCMGLPQISLKTAGKWSAFKGQVTMTPQ